MRQQQGASRIVSVGYWLPNTVVKTSEMLDEARIERFGVTNNYIADTMGIREVRHAAHNQNPSDLAIAAAERALVQADVNPDEIDLIIFCGIEGDYAEPSTAHIVQAALGLSAVCFDISNACMGFTSGLQIANDMIKGGSVRYALVCTGERTSRVSKGVIKELQKTPLKSVFKEKVGMLSVGDAGGAVIVGPADRASRIIRFLTVTDSKLADLCYYRIARDVVKGRMAMGKICAAMLRTHEYIYRNGNYDKLFPIKKVDCIITHQVGLRAWERFAKIFSCPQGKLTKTFDTLGNLTTATLPVNLSLALKTGKVRKNSKILAAMAGSGISNCQMSIQL